VMDTAPSVLIVSPGEGATTIEGGQLTLSAQASDNVQVSQIVWSLNGASESPVFTPPFEKTVSVPIDITSLNIQVTATDNIGQTGSAARTITVLTDPPPTVVITSPIAGASVTEGSQLTLSATATDNAQVNRFTWTVNGVEQTPIFSPPYDKVVMVPLDVTFLTIEGVAMDNLGRNGVATRTITVIPAPKTTVIGRVVSNLGQPISGAMVTVFVQYTAVSQIDGTFSIPDVPTVLGSISAAVQVPIGGSIRTGVSASVTPVDNGITDVGDITIAGAAVADLYPGPKISIDAAAYVAVGDFNRDGILDIAAPNISTNDVWVFLATSSGTFQTEQRFPTGNLPWAIAAADLNSDGFLDLVTTNGSSDDVSVLLGIGNGAFQAHQRFATGDFPYSVALVDLNGDGFSDIVVANANSSDVSILLGHGNGAFQSEQRLS
ncbi:MAG: FG-GAP-like repeat-containing protein, partial [Candidatus Binatia bacterium]